MKELLDLPPCPVRKCSQCGCEVGWSWVSRDHGCSECATVGSLSMAIAIRDQQIEDLRALLGELRKRGQGLTTSWLDIEDVQRIDAVLGTTSAPNGDK